MRRLERGENLEDLLPEAFATAREVAARALSMRHFDVQLMGGIVLHEGKIAEMKTGEGKTLIATLPAYLNSLSGKPVHIVTVNDYLAKRDAEWMGHIYRALGMSVGFVVSQQPHKDKKHAYACDVVYATNNELGFDYLRDNMVLSRMQQTQRGHCFAVVDEVDSILIDEARTPLIISGPAQGKSLNYRVIDGLARKLIRQETKDGDGDFSVDEKNRQAALTDQGHQKMELLLCKEKLIEDHESLYSPQNIGLLHHVNCALRAQTLYRKDVEYIVKNRKVVIIDEFTGRIMPGRRWSDGLHQAIEAKERVPVEAENQTQASITFQNYFRLYKRLSGMTGTADTEASELQDIYGLEVVVIPTHKPMLRMDYADKIYMTQKEKFAAIVEEIADRVARGQPVLVGTSSVEASEQIASLLKESSIDYQVLNAKNPALESKIIAQAGTLRAVTIATNMAGRGTDIVLGGGLDAMMEGSHDHEKEGIRSQWQKMHEKVVNLGGLHIIGSERHESRRGRQSVTRQGWAARGPRLQHILFVSGRQIIANLLRRKSKSPHGQLGMQEGESIEHPWVTKAVEKAQRKVETYNYDIRKNLLEYDDIANEQRKIIYQQRNELLSGDCLSDSVGDLIYDACATSVGNYVSMQTSRSEWDIPGLCQHAKERFGSILDADMLQEDDDLDLEKLQQMLSEEASARYEQKKKGEFANQFLSLEKPIMLRILDFFGNKIC